MTNLLIARRNAQGCINSLTEVITAGYALALIRRGSISGGHYLTGVPDQP